MAKNLNNKNVLVGVTSGISAYKTAYLVRLLQNYGASVRVVMSKSAKDFITPLTFQALTSSPVLTEFETNTNDGMGHIELARWADFIIIAPATANFIANLASGQADDLLSTICLASVAKIAVAPAMNKVMCNKPVLQNNLTQLQKNQILIFGPAEGEQACGDVGAGRMLEPAQIVELISLQFSNNLLDGKTILITAGPTIEPIDPMRFLSNHSSGKMAYALAGVAIEMGAKVVLVSGPVNLAPPSKASVIKVTTANQMLDEVLIKVTQADWFIGVAAVADYRPKTPNTQKIKKTSENITIELVPNPDILQTVANHKNRPELVIGFAAETENLNENATKKLTNKNLDFIIANQIGENLGIISDNNKVNIIWQNGNKILSLTSKQNIARQILQFLKNAQNTT